MNRGARAPGGPRARPQKIKQENNRHTSEKLKINLNKVRKRCVFLTFTVKDCSTRESDASYLFSCSGKSQGK